MKKKRKRWTEEEKEFLIENYGKLKTSDIANHLNRNEWAVRDKASRIGIAQKSIANKKKYIKWKLINEILNVVRKAKGLPIVPASENPYIKIT